MRKAIFKMRMRQVQEKVVWYVIKYNWFEVSSLEAITMIAWEAVTLEEDEISEEMMPELIIHHLPHPTAIEIAVMIDRDDREYLLRLVEHLSEVGYICWLGAIVEGTIQVTFL